MYNIFLDTHTHTRMYAHINGRTIRKFVCTARADGAQQIKCKFFLTWRFDDGFPGKLPVLFTATLKSPLLGPDTKFSCVIGSKKEGVLLRRFKIILSLSLRKKKAYDCFKVQNDGERKSPPSL